MITALKYKIPNLDKLPSAVASLALSLSTLGILWSYTIPKYQHIIDPITLFAAIALLSLLFLRFIFYPKTLYTEILDTYRVSLLPTVPMALMIVAQKLLPINERFASTLWLFAVTLNLLILYFFTTRWIHQFNVKHTLPSWLLPPTGLAFASLTSIGMSFDSLRELLLYIAIAYYIILLPLMMARVNIEDKLPDYAKPTLTIIAAPPNIVLATYLSISPHINPTIICFLVPLCLSFTSTIYLYLIRLIRLPFKPSHAVMNFPAIIGSTAMIKLHVWLNLKGYHSLVVFVDLLGYIELSVASFIVFFVVTNFIHITVKETLC